MDEWDQGYTDGFDYALMTVQELAAGRTEIKVGDVLDALEVERRILLTPGLCYDSGGVVGVREAGR